MRGLVTGVGGFIGSHVADRLCADSWSVVGVDSMTDYYDPYLKSRNVEELRSYSNFEFKEADLVSEPLEAMFEGVDVVFHQAGQPGVRTSWDGFDRYLRHNVEGTHRLLEAAAGRESLYRFVFASSSSIYGQADEYPTPEDALPKPVSPYGVSKLAAEHLCGVYAHSFGVPTVSLRYFTVFGPRQRPDMAMSRLIDSAVGGGPFPLYGDGDQVRDFTYVGDVVEANLLAATKDVPRGFVANVAGGSPASMRHVIESVGRLVGSAPVVDRQEPQAGDVRRTGGSTQRIRSVLGWEPTVSLDEGLRKQIDWHLSNREFGALAGIGNLRQTLG